MEQAWAVALNPLWPACGPPRQRRTSDAIAVGWWPCPWRQQPHFGAPPKSCLQGCVKDLSHIRCCKSVLATTPPPMHAPCRVRELLCVHLRQGERLDLTMRALPDTGFKQRADCKHLQASSCAVSRGELLHCLCRVSWFALVHIAASCTHNAALACGCGHLQRLRYDLGNLCTRDLSGDGVALISLNDVRHVLLLSGEACRAGHPQIKHQHLKHRGKHRDKKPQILLTPKGISENLLPADWSTHSTWTRRPAWLAVFQAALCQQSSQQGSNLPLAGSLQGSPAILKCLAILRCLPDLQLQPAGALQTG